MAGCIGLSIALVLSLAGSGAILPAQEPAAPGSDSGRLSLHRAKQQQALNSLRERMAAPQPADPSWRRLCYGSLTYLDQLETAELVQEVDRGWHSLVSEGGDVGLANWLLYRRRHDLALPANASEVEDLANLGPNAALELCLAFWGESRWQEAKSGFRQALAKYPQEDRLRQNLLWLQRSPPPYVSLEGSSRHLALNVLAARQAHP
ncbi:MAG: hypothetical protein DWQ01_13255 [Planctomycetota bacterium]|nr:MAG: hypothetical protein DWQ01_13255 [Planctomycetota bacterium]